MRKYILMGAATLALLWPTWAMAESWLDKLPEGSYVVLGTIKVSGKPDVNGAWSVRPFTSKEACEAQLHASDDEQWRASLMQLVQIAQQQHGTPSVRCVSVPEAIKLTTAGSDV